MSSPTGRSKVKYNTPARIPAVDPDAPDGPESDAKPKPSSRRRSRPASPLLSVCEPLFSQICIYSHAMQNGATLQSAQVRADVEALLARIRTAAHEQPATAGAFDEQLEQALIFFVDNFFAECGQQQIAYDWSMNRLAFGLKPPNYVGDEQFFTNLESTLRDKSEQGNERLAVYFACIGLGMTGIYANKPQILRKKQLEIAQRIGGLLESNAKRRICPDAYENIDTQNLIEPPIKPPVFIALALAGMLLVLVGVYFVAYRSATSDLNQQLLNVQNAAQAAR